MDTNFVKFRYYLYMEKEYILSIISSNIRAERARKKLSQEQLAEASGITTKYLNMIENAKANPSIFVVINICLALKVKLNQILPDDII